MFDYNQIFEMKHDPNSPNGSGITLGPVATPAISGSDNYDLNFNPGESFRSDPFAFDGMNLGGSGFDFDSSPVDFGGGSDFSPAVAPSVDFSFDTGSFISTLGNPVTPFASQFVTDVGNFSSLDMSASSALATAMTDISALDPASTDYDIASGQIINKYYGGLADKPTAPTAPTAPTKPVAPAAPQKNRMDPMTWLYAGGLIYQIIMNRENRKKDEDRYDAEIALRAEERKEDTENLFALKNLEHELGMERDAANDKGGGAVVRGSNSQNYTRRTSPA